MKKSPLLLATAACALLVAGTATAQVTTTERVTTTAPVAAKTTTTKTTSSETGPLTNVTNTTISSETVADTAVKTTVTEVDKGAGTVTKTTVTDTAPVVTRSEMQVQTKEQAIAPADTRLFTITEFDVNKDGILTRAEVGERLFKMYDADGNEVIDNLEYARPAIITVLPVEKTVTITYDFDGDGVVESQERVYENFVRYTQLARFDGDKDGLSPREFVDLGFLEADIDDDNFVNMKEWQGSYNAAIDRSNKIKGNLNK